MPRYYLHQRMRLEYVRDFEGSDLPDLEAARREATLSAREIMSFAIYDGLDVSGRFFEIADETGDVLATLPFTEAISKAD